MYKLNNYTNVYIYKQAPQSLSKIQMIEQQTQLLLNLL